jgi:hypothetical protein
MGYYNNILNLLSLALTFAILFIVIFGCQFKRYRRIEGFTGTTEEPEKEEKEKEKEKEEEKEEEFKTLEGFEGKILNGLNDGSITNEEMEKLIENGSFTRKNLENIISYIDNFKEHLRL